MQRYLSLPLFLIFSIVFLLQPAVEVQGEQLPVQQGKAKQRKTTASAKKKKAASKTETAPKATRKKQPIAQTAQKSSKKEHKKHQVASSTASRKSRGIVSTKNRKATSNRSVTARKHHSRLSRSVVSRKKISTRQEAQTQVDSEMAGNLPNIDRMISSRSCMIMDAGTGATLFAKAPDIPRQPASTIKIVTAMIALKSLKNDEIINVSRRASEMPSSKLFLDPNRDYRANDLINGVLLASANDASVALAEKIAGTEDKFANLMTLSAKMWGAQNTICRTASGLTAEGQHSTARDLANLFRYAMQHNEFARRMREKTICTSYGKTLLNHNKALWRVDGAVGGKTGYTVAARQTYVGQFTRDNNTIVVAIMGSETMWADLKKLVEYGFSKKKQEQLAQNNPDAAGNNIVHVN